jgi:NADH-quinone oxidoreductase subunit J
VRAEFIAMLLVIVYVGAVAVLFLFVVMMLDIEVAAMRAGFARYLPLGLALAVALLAEVIIAFQAWSVGGVQLAARAAPIAPEVSNIQAIGNLLYALPVHLRGAGLVLLVAMIGAIVLTHRQRGGVVRRTSPSRMRVSRMRRSATSISPSGRGWNCDDRSRPLSGRRGDPVHHGGAGHLPQPEEPHRHPDGDRADPARREPEPRRLLGRASGSGGTGLRHVRADRGRR